jgi:hypothetical protein
MFHVEHIDLRDPRNGRDFPTKAGPPSLLSSAGKEPPDVSAETIFLWVKLGLFHVEHAGGSNRPAPPPTTLYATAELAKRGRLEWEGHRGAHLFHVEHGTNPPSRAGVPASRDLCLTDH